MSWDRNLNWVPKASKRSHLVHVLPSTLQSLLWRPPSVPLLFYYNDHFLRCGSHWSSEICLAHSNQNTPLHIMKWN
jgi:hypothetical protein